VKYILDRAHLLLLLLPFLVVRLLTLEAAEEPGNGYTKRVPYSLPTIVNKTEETLNQAVRDLSDQCTQWDGHDTEEQTPSPLSTCKWRCIERFASLENDDELTSNSDELHTDKPWVAKDSLIPNIQLVIDPPTVVLIEKLHPHVNVQYQRLELLYLKLSVRIEQVPASVMNNKNNYQLIDGLANDHFPHRDRDNRGIARLRLSLQEIGRRMISSVAKRSKDIHNQVDPKQLNHSKNGVANKLRNDSNNACSDVDGKLELPSY
jgi:hypothetical protein